MLFCLSSNNKSKVGWGIVFSSFLRLDTVSWVLLPGVLTAACRLSVFKVGFLLLHWGLFGFVYKNTQILQHSHIMMLLIYTADWVFSFQEECHVSGALQRPPVNPEIPKQVLGFLFCEVYYWCLQEGPPWITRGWRCLPACTLQTTSTAGKIICMESLMPETLEGESFLGPQCTVFPMVCLFCVLLITVNQKDNS